ncbi:MAG: zinc ribbon domain-containing protein [Bryobacterales bacterium]|nr:zinc ribbon domain-containing protein [Bryobacterales bacterium]MBV9396562.1 zinc ribbon domain-containing protein [Bryobacterales bacterium]
MPLYEYRCSKCDTVFEVLQKFSDAPLTTHESCGGALERLISAPGFQFKGSGWYVTDYKGSGAKTETKAADGDKKADTKTDSKPASTESKTESKPAETAKKSE